MDQKNRGPGPGVALVAVLGLLALCVAPYTYLFRDYEYVRGTMRGLQDALVWLVRGTVVATVGALLLALGAATLGLRWLWHRTDGAVVRAELERRAAVELELARQSQYPELTNYSPRIEIETTHAAPALPAPVAEPPPAPALTLTPGRTLLDLRERGLIGQPGRLALGLSGSEAIPVAVGVASMIAVGGNPRMGKSTAAVWLISQAALMGWSVYLCDPHGHDPQSILARIEPIAPLLARRAVASEEIAEAVAAFDALGQGRLHGGDADRTPALLVIDELPALALSGQLPRATMETLIRIGSQYPKAGLLMMGIGYDWSGALFNSPYAAPLRRLALPRVVVNADPDTAEPLVGRQLARRARELTRGQALYLAYGASGLMEVPQITSEDLRSIAGQCPAPPPPPALLTLEATPAPAVGEIPLAERILALLAAAGPSPSRAISDALGADINQVCARLDELVEAGQLHRAGARRSYTYAVSTISHPPQRG